MTDLKIIGNTLVNQNASTIASTTESGNHNTKINSVWTQKLEGNLHESDHVSTDTTNNKPQKSETVTNRFENNPPEETKPQGNDKNKSEYTDYTVQSREDFRDLMVRSLKAQHGNKADYEPTEDEIKQAIEDFKAHNDPKVLGSKNGKYYLYVGMKIKVAGGLEDKNNSSEQVNKWKENIKGHSDIRTKSMVKGAKPKTAAKQKVKNKKHAADRVTNKSQYKESDCKGVYYNPATGLHYKKENGKYVKIPTEGENCKITQYFSDGSHYEVGKSNDGTLNIKIYVRADKSKQVTFTDPKTGKIDSVCEWTKDNNRTQTNHYKNGKVTRYVEYTGKKDNEVTKELIYNDKGECKQSNIYYPGGKNIRRTSYYYHDKNQTKTTYYFDQQGHQTAIEYRNKSGYIKTEYYNTKGQKMSTRLANGHIQYYKV